MASRELNISEQIITPQMAKEWLAHNTHNRRLSKRLVSLLARDMASGNWQLNGDAIRFNGDGMLIDGQHRLMAIVESGQKVKSLVITGLPKRVQETVDMGRKRSPGDVLELRGHAYATALAAAAARLLDVKRGSQDKGRSTTAEILAVIERHPKLPSSVETCHHAYPVPASIMSAVHYITNHMIRGRKDEAEAFVNVLMNGKPAFKDDPAHKFREKLIRVRAAKQHLRTWEMLASTLRIWNAFVTREPLEKIYFTDEMPSIAGFNPERL